MRFGAVFGYFIKGYRADGAQLLIWAHGEKTKSHVDKLQHEKMAIRDKRKIISEMLRSGLHEPPSCQVCFDQLGARIWTRSPPVSLSSLGDSVVFVVTVYVQSVGQYSCNTI